MVDDDVAVVDDAGDDDVDNPLIECCRDRLVEDDCGIFDVDCGNNWSEIEAFLAKCNIFATFATLRFKSTPPTGLNGE